MQFSSNMLQRTLCLTVKTRTLSGYGSRVIQFANAVTADGRTDIDDSYSRTASLDEVRLKSKSYILPKYVNLCIILTYTL